MVIRPRARASRPAAILLCHGRDRYHRADARLGSPRSQARGVGISAATSSASGLARRARGLTRTLDGRIA